ncbi:hypothetical protein Taro_055414 [Colocasia esculenta]|uniref:Uncharacterized protein n=1 Tax=Colocasia esculenta TaxID=4460 RepID=A0A843XT83_COLES|nr:hypothetical protein [Colocasia esculenta]
MEPLFGLTSACAPHVVHGAGLADACSRHEDTAWSGGNAVRISYFAFFVEVTDPPIATRSRQADPLRSCS